MYTDIPKVYILSGNDYGEDFIIGAFQDYSKATAFKRSLRRYNKKCLKVTRKYNKDRKDDSLGLGARAIYRDQILKGRDFRVGLGVLYGVTAYDVIL